MDYVILYAVDAALLILLLITVLRCAHLGLARSLAGIVAWIAAAAIALHFCAPLSQALYNRFLQQHVLSAAQERIHSTIDSDEVVDITTTTMDALPGFVIDAAEGMGVDVSALREKTTHMTEMQDNAAAAIEQNVLAPIITAVLKIVLFLLMAILIAAVAQAILSPIGKALHKMPVIGATDRALGAVLGILKGAVLVSVLAILLHVLGNMLQGAFSDAVHNSKIVSFIAESPFADGVFR
ncbi:MAG: CvpA family protein [Clostridia bacterium]|nr:CvpA family protein [Clostridia bacterium]